MAVRSIPSIEPRAKILRAALHLITWMLIWANLRYFSISSLTRDSAEVVTHASFAILIQSVVVFYGLGSFVFPRYLYQGRILELITSLLAFFQLIHISNYYEFQYLYRISLGRMDSSVVYITRTWEGFFSVNRWTSCFTDFKVAYIDYAWSLFYVTPILAIKVMRDVILLRTQNLRLERDRLQLEKNNLDLQSESLKLQRDNLNLELSFLKAQINPHFLFNTLNAIYVKTAEVDDQAADLVMRLSNLMRYSLYESNRDKVILTKETDYIESYIELERMRFGERVSISYHLEGQTDMYNMAPLLLISFVENAFKHGTGRRSNPSYVHISIVVDDSRLYFLIKNSISESVAATSDGVQSQDQVGGFGLMSTEKRLQLLYPGKHFLQIVHEKDFFEVRLELLLQKIPVA